ncbi:hypothetical protein [Streptomyces chiangmaiensis]|uniref:Cupin domain-containing protein n=1 Tax=Streptomyces chiangmaiensis TaxID=766497 RepID=A0ABU7FGF3_9ACTN|nr:hypothetical protein [Streptomyces chiangmaiensis]MED7823066.1 hypothetical protein [Streptomyces chiangmaiensis]
MSEAARRPTPRPTYDHPTVIRQQDAVRHLWGDPGGSGHVSDLVYVSSADLHVLQFTLTPRGRYVHSALNPTVFAADVAYVVLEGELVLVDPEHGEVRPLTAGEVGFFRRDTWNHAVNPRHEPVRVLEFFAPPPSRNTASPYARNKPLLAETRYRDARWDGRWPAAAPDREAAARIHVVREADRLHWLPEDDGGHLAGTAVDTEYLTVTHGRLSPAHSGQVHTTSDETVLYVTDGALHLHLPEHDGPAWHRVGPDDAAYLPKGTAYQLVDVDGRGARFWAGAGRVPDGWQP